MDILMMIAGTILGTITGCWFASKLEKWRMLNWLNNWLKKMD